MMEEYNQRLLLDDDLELRRSHPSFIQEDVLIEEEKHSFPSELRRSFGTLIEENLLNKDDFDVEV